MKAFFLTLLFLCGGAWAQPGSPAAGDESLPNLPDQTVVAVFDDGAQLTMGELKQILAVLPAQNQQFAKAQRKTFVQQWAMMRKLAQLAEKQGLDKQSPFQEQLLYSRLMVLSQAILGRTINTIEVSQEDINKSYEAGKERYKEVQVKAIYVSFGDAPAAGKQALSEEQAKEKALKLLAEVRAGADFVKLVKENSDDETSRDKDGDFATLRPKDNVPDAIRSAVFKLKEGEVSEPIRQPNGYYLLKANKVTYRPIHTVTPEIVAEIRQQRYAEWLKQINDSTTVEYPEPRFLAPSPAAPPTAPSKTDRK